MKPNIIIATAVSVGVLLIAFVQAAILIAGNITQSQAPTFGAGAGVADFLATPAVFLIIGLIYGLIAGTQSGLKQILIIAALTGTAIAVALEVFLPKLIRYEQLAAARSGQPLPFSVSDSTPSALLVFAIVVWVAWYVMGAALGYRIRNNRKSVRS